MKFIHCFPATLQNDDEHKKLLISRERRIGELLQQLQAVRDDYDQRTNDLQKAYAELKLKDGKDKQEIDRQDNEMQSLQVG